MAQRVLVTGPSGYSHVFQQVLANKAYRVRGTVRSVEKAEAIKKLYPNDGDRIEFSIVQDISKPGAFSDAVKDVDLILHVASPFHFKFEKNDELLIPAVQGTKGLLEEAIQQSSVKRVIVTSSFAAIIQQGDPVDPEYTYTPDIWSNTKWDEAQKTTDKGYVYRASKAFAEKAAWDFVKTQKPKFDLVTICPPFVFGPVVGDVSREAVKQSNMQLWNFLSGDTIPAPLANPYWVDVRDLAFIHVKALELAKASGQRYLTTAGYFTFPHAVEVLRKRFPAQKLPSVPSDYKMKIPFHLDASKAERDFGIKWTPFDKTVVDTFEQLYSL